jgi:hypothetical protein
MKTIKFTYDENSKPIAIGSFKFNIGKTFYDKDYTPIKTISFEFSPEIKQIIGTNENELFELIGNKLKEDFIAQLKGRM